MRYSFNGLSATWHNALYTCLFAFLFASGSHAEETVCFEKYISGSTVIVGMVSNPEGFKNSPAENQQVSTNTTDAVICNRGGISHYNVEICTEGKRTTLWEKKQGFPVRDGFPDDWYQLKVFDVALNPETGEAAILYFLFWDIYVDIVQLDKEQNEYGIKSSHKVLHMPFEEPILHGHLIWHKKIYILTDARRRGMEMRKLDKGKITLIYRDNASEKAEEAYRQSEDTKKLLDSMLNQ